MASEPMNLLWFSTPPWAIHTRLKGTSIFSKMSSRLRSFNRPSVARQTFAKDSSTKWPTFIRAISSKRNQCATLIALFTSLPSLSHLLKMVTQPIYLHQFPFLADRHVSRHLFSFHNRCRSLVLYVPFLCIYLWRPVLPGLGDVLGLLPLRLFVSGLSIVMKSFPAMPTSPVHNVLAELIANVALEGPQAKSSRGHAGTRASSGFNPPNPGLAHHERTILMQHRATSWPLPNTSDARMQFIVKVSPPCGARVSTKPPKPNLPTVNSAFTGGKFCLPGAATLSDHRASTATTRKVPISEHAAELWSVD